MCSTLNHPILLCCLRGGCYYAPAQPEPGYRDTPDHPEAYCYSLPTFDLRPRERVRGPPFCGTREGARSLSLGAIPQSSCEARPTDNIIVQRCAALTVNLPLFFNLTDEGAC